MAIPIIPTAAACLLLALAIYKLIIHPAFLSPLSRIPNAHWSAPFSSLWILFHRQQQDDTTTVHAAHVRLGSIIRLAPEEISVNSVEGGIRTIYSGGFEKGTWYSNIFSNYGVEPMFAMENHGPHSKRRRMLSNIYAKSILQGSEALTKQTGILISERLQARLREEGRKGEVEMYDIYSAVTMDFVSGYIFGLKNCSDFIRNREEGIKLFHDFKARQKYSFWPQEMAGLTRFMKKIGLKGLLVPSWVDTANQEIEDWVTSLCEKAEKTQRDIDEGKQVEVEDLPSVYAQLRNTLLKEEAKEEKGDVSIEEQVRRIRLNIATEVLDHTLAGFDTSGITLTWLTWQISRPQNFHWQEKLQEEISSLQGSLDAKAIDALPILHAILMETLRLHAAIPGNQPRITPPSTTTILNDYHVPPNIRVQSQAYSLHRNPAVFPDPDVFNPSRWLPAPTSEMGRWFWAFSSGGRMCIGSNLAMLDMKATIVGVWGKWTTKIVDDRGMVPNGGYMAEPLGVGPGGRKGIGKGRRFCVCEVTERG